MNRLRWLIAVPLLLGASWARGSEIRDEAGLFSKDAIREAQTVLDSVEGKQHVPTVIETIDSLDGRGIDAVSLDRAKRSGIKGVFVLISKREHKIEARDYKSFLGASGRKAIEQAFASGFRGGDFDGGLKAGVLAIAEQVNTSGGIPQETAPRRGRAALPPPPGGRRGGGGSSGLGVLLVIGLVILAVLIGLRLLGGLFRGAGGYGPAPMGRPGYGPGYGAGYGGRGGGFFSGLLGGLGGAMAGNWLYDQFRGHRGGYTNTGDVGNYGGVEAPPPSEGADWGGGGGGTDWGGGDAGGGGDWGGGGGDWGGGGGDGGSW